MYKKLNKLTTPKTNVHMLYKNVQSYTQVTKAKRATKKHLIEPQKQAKTTTNSYTQVIKRTKTVTITKNAGFNISTPPNNTSSYFKIYIYCNCIKNLSTLKYRYGQFKI